MAHSCNGHVPWTFTASRALVLAESPGKDEVALGQGLVGATGQVVWKAFDRAGWALAQTEVARGNVVTCRPPDKPSARWWKEAYEAHAEEMAEGLARVSPTHILAIGGHALYRLFGRADVTRLRGSIFLHEPTGALVVPAIHPAALMQAGSLLGRPASGFKPVFDMDVRRFVNLIRNGLPSLGKLTWNAPFSQEDFVDIEGTTLAYDIETHQPTDTVVRINYGHVGAAGNGYGVSYPFDRDQAAWLLDHKCRWSGHNTRFDDPRLAKVGVRIAGELHDTIESAAVCWPDLPRNLEFQASLHWQGYMAWKKLTEDPFLQRQWTLRLGLPETFNWWDALYGSLDGAAQAVVDRGHFEKMAQDGTYRLYVKNHMGIRKPLVAAEEKGLRVDEEALKQMRREAKAKKAEAVAVIQPYVDKVIAGEEALHQGEIEAVNRALSLVLGEIRPCHKHPDYRGETARKKCQECARVRAEAQPLLEPFREQIARSKTLSKRYAEIREEGRITDEIWRKVLFEELKLPQPLKTDGGKASVSDDAIEILRRKVPKVDPRYAILEARTTIAELSHALRVPLRPPVGGDGFLHSPFLSHTTGTGRCSSGQVKDDSDKEGGSKFNLQNVKKLYRRAYVPSTPDRWFVSGDYSQMERWTTALEARDEKTLDMLRRGLDLHREFAAFFLKKPVEAVTADERQLFKTVSFAKLYGASPDKLVILTGKTYRECVELSNAHDRMFPATVTFQQEVVARAMKERRLVMPSGRIRWFHGVRVYRKKDGTFSYSTSEREEIIATLPQSDAADIGREAVIRTYDAGLDFRAFVHDEVLIEASKLGWQEAARMLKAIMETPVRWLSHLNGGEPFVPPVDLKVGGNWSDYHETENPSGLRKVKSDFTLV